MNTVGTCEAKAHLSRLLARVEKGEQFIITRHGAPVARLVPTDNAAKMSPGDVVAELRKLRKNCMLGGLPLRPLIEEGR
jgi:prevent-host-death family protein